MLQPPIDKVLIKAKNTQLKWRHDIKHNDTQHNDTQHNIIYNATLSIITLSVIAKHFLLSVIFLLSVTNRPFMLTVNMLNVIILSVVAPQKFISLLNAVAVLQENSEQKNIWAP
jgi:hypothetical protein